MSVPFLSITPDGGTPIPVNLSKVSDARYEWDFTIYPSTLSDTVWAVFSARVPAGNRGTQIRQRTSITIDTLLSFSGSS